MQRLRVSYRGAVVQATPGQDVIVGRDPGCQVRVEDRRASRRHASISWDGRTWVVSDTGSVNGIYVDGVRVSAASLRDEHAVHLGPDVDSPYLQVQVNVPKPPVESAGGAGQHTRTAPVSPPGPEATRIGPQRHRHRVTAGHHAAPPPPPPRASGGPVHVVRIGRDPANHHVIEDLLVSRFHAQLTLHPDGATITDLGSSNGTFLNGQRLQWAHTPIREGDVLAVGDEELLFQRGRLRPRRAPDDITLTATDLSYALPNGRALLDGINLHLPARSLTAVIGPSGAGKSTLLKVLTGSLRPSAGSVGYGGRDLYANIADLRRRAGVVPQDDVMHRQLTVRQVLDYSAELRFPPDLPREARGARVQETITELGLREHAGTRVDRLSGGQRKRTSIAIEMLTRPALLFLDEPTSGLDPNLERSVMQELRRLADDGQTVLVITHSLAQLALCDTVVLLAPGGKPTYIGTPQGLLTHFGATDYETIYDLITRAPDQHRDRFEQVRAGRDHHHPAVSTPEPAAPARQSRPRQISTLSRRHLRVMVADRSHALFTALLPAVLAVLALAVPGSDGFRHVPETPGDEAVQLLVVLVIGAVFMGMSATVREAVGERDVFRREAAVGLAPFSYLAAKLLVFTALAAVQAAVLVGIVLLVKPAPRHGVLLDNGGLEVYLVIALATAGAAGVGLLMSSLVSTSEQVMPLLVIVMMTQLVLCGGMIPVTDRTPLSQISWFAPGRWAYAAGASTIEIGALVVHAEPDDLWRHQPDMWLLSMGMLAAIWLVCAIGTWAQLRRTVRPG